MRLCCVRNTRNKFLYFAVEHKIAIACVHALCCLMMPFASATAKVWKFIPVKSIGTFNETILTYFCSSNEIIVPLKHAGVITWHRECFVLTMHSVKSRIKSNRTLWFIKLSYKPITKWHNISIASKVEAFPVWVTYDSIVHTQLILTLHVFNV